MRLRPYTDDDLTDVLELWQRASLQAHAFLSTSFLAEERRLLAEEWLPSARTTVAERDGRVVGFLSLVGSEIGGLFVDPSAQRAGVGRALVDAAAEVHPALEVEVFERNTIGRAFYGAYGFATIDRFIHEGSGEPLVRLRCRTSTAST